MVAVVARVEAAGGIGTLEARGIYMCSVGVVSDPSGAAGWELLVVGRAGAGAAVPEAAQSAPRRRALPKVPPSTMARNGPDGL